MATRGARPDDDVAVKLPDYLTTTGMPYEVRVIEMLPEEAYGTEVEAIKIVWAKDSYASVREFLVCYFHMAFETAKMENVAPLEDHGELDRLAHVAAEWAEALIMAQ